MKIPGALTDAWLAIDWKKERIDIESDEGVGQLTDAEWLDHVEYVVEDMIEEGVSEYIEAYRKSRDANLELCEEKINETVAEYHTMNFDSMYDDIRSLTLDDISVEVIDIEGYINDIDSLQASLQALKTCLEDIRDCERFLVEKARWENS
jgi:hypothetical protein